jgi:Phytanoyl-CoA dioxygenase (PhyH)
MAGPLTDRQLDEYAEKGYLLVGGLVPAEVAAAADAAMWRAFGADPQDRSTWSRITGAHTTFEDRALLACYTPSFLQAAAQVAGDDPATFRAPSRAYAIPVVPADAQWRWPRPHIDHAIKEHGHHTFPPPFRVASMTFLHDLASHGGGTVVWPGSHRLLAELARSDPQRYELMWSLNQALHDRQSELGEPIELAPRAGDVLLYDYICAHAGSMNTVDRPRFAMNAKW